MPLDPNDAAMLNELAKEAALEDERTRRDPPWAYRLRALATLLPGEAELHGFAPHPDSVARHLKALATPDTLALLATWAADASDYPASANARAILAILNELVAGGEPAAAAPVPAAAKRVHAVAKKKAAKARK